MFSSYSARKRTKSFGKVMIVLLAVLSFGAGQAFALAGVKSKFDFRKAIWGDTEETIDPNEAVNNREVVVVSGDEDYGSHVKHATFIPLVIDIPLPETLYGHYEFRVRPGNSKILFIEGQSKISFPDGGGDCGDARFTLDERYGVTAVFDIDTEFHFKRICKYKTLRLSLLADYQYADDTNEIKLTYAHTSLTGRYQRHTYNLRAASFNDDSSTVHNHDIVVVSGNEDYAQEIRHRTYIPLIFDVPFPEALYGRYEFTLKPGNWGIRFYGGSSGTVEPFLPELTFPKGGGGCGKVELLANNRNELKYSFIPHKNTSINAACTGKTLRFYVMAKYSARANEFDFVYAHTSPEGVTEDHAYKIKGASFPGKAYSQELDSIQIDIDNNSLVEVKYVSGQGWMGRFQEPVFFTISDDADVANTDLLLSPYTDQRASISDYRYEVTLVVRSYKYLEPDKSGPAIYGELEYYLVHGGKKQLFQKLDRRGHQLLEYDGLKKQPEDRERTLRSYVRKTSTKEKFEINPVKDWFLITDSFPVSGDVNDAFALLRLNAEVNIKATLHVQRKILPGGNIYVGDIVYSDTPRAVKSAENLFNVVYILQDQ